MAKNDPVKLAGYSVSDAVATYFLYNIFVHPFIFSLCTLIPMPPDDVLRKGSGTLCEALLMVKAFQDNIVCPNRHKESPDKTYKGHLVESETYVGGHVEALRSGIYRSDIQYTFNLNKKTYENLIESLDEILEYVLKEEMKVDKQDIKNYDEIKESIRKSLSEIKEKSPSFLDFPKIYHLDVGAMYPNVN
jgi:DNA polymerase epsilon subunit 1